MEKKIENVTIIGGGVLGSQISWQIAFKGYHVKVYDIDPKGIEISKTFHQKYALLYATLYPGKTSIEETFAHIEYCTNLREAVENADLISESIPENLELKRKCFQEISSLVQEDTLLTTNTSTLVPSQIADIVKHNQRFISMHFANKIWKNNICEIMKHEHTSEATIQAVARFATSIDMVPIIIKKEQSGYLLNSMLVPFLNAATDLYLNNVADFRDVDRTWMICSGMNMGPFGIVDTIGLETVYNIKMLVAHKTQNTMAFENAHRIKEQFIDTGKIGVKAGVGFYTYPHPEYETPDFLIAKTDITN
jgi:3-hydroxyacyl-CoA dehydrogenase